MVSDFRGEEKEIKVVYDDQDLAIVDKPAGVVTTVEGRRSGVVVQTYLEDWVGKKWPNCLPRKGIVHRLDKDTSGLVVVAKNADSLSALKRMFKERVVIKRYLALAGGDLPLVGDMNMPIDRSRYTLGKFKVDVDGKNAVTEFRVLRKILIQGKKFSLVEVGLKTGRTHQIRVHFSYMGWPLLGDRTYKGMQVSGIDRQFLHAKFISFLHPITGKQIEASSELPTDLQKIINSYAV